jgi:drug/metabolite transporter (DMT)-like permease
VGQRPRHPDRGVLNRPTAGTAPVDPLRGALFVVAAALMFAGVGAVVKSIAAELPNEVLVFFRNLFGVLFVLPLLGAGRVSLRTPVLHLHLLRALFGVAALYGYFHVLGRIPLGEAVLLTFSAPLFIPFLARMALGEPVSPRLIGAIVLGFAGILLILKPGTGLFRPVVLVGVFSGVMAAAAMVCVRQLGRRREPATRVVFYFALLASAVSAVPLAWAWQTPPASTWPALLAVAALASAGQYLLTRGYACAPAAQVGPFSYFSVLFSALIGWLFWQELPDALSQAGGVLVVIAGVVAVRQRAAAPTEPV